MIAALLIFGHAAAAAGSVPHTQPADCVTHVLFFGNSYTYFNDLPAIFAQLAADGHQCKVDARMVAPGGVRLKDHWDKPEAHAALNSQKWDYVVLQDQSTLGMTYYVDGNPRVTSDEIFLPYARKWVEEITQHGARPVFYLTWARKATPDDQAALDYAYVHAAKETGAAVAPVGVAWQQLLRENPTINLYYKDGSHPSTAGSYLAACVMYATIFGRSPVGLASHISGVPVNLDTEKPEPEKTAVLVDLPKADAEIIQRAAWQTWQSLQKTGGYPEVHPLKPPEPIFVARDSLSPEKIAGTWSGQFLFYPGVGPVQMELQVERDGAAWKGHLKINYPVKDFANESFDLGDLRVGEREVAFSDPKSAGVNNWRIDFRGALAGGDLKGTAETKVEREGSPVVVAGEWSLHKMKP